MKQRDSYMVSTPLDEGGPEKKRVEFWKEYCDAHLFTGDHAHFENAPFRVKAVRQESGLYTLHTHRTQGQLEVTRTASQIRNDPDEDYSLLFLTAGTNVITMGDQQAEATPGTALLGTVTTPFRYRMNEAAGYTFKVPSQEINGRLNHKGPLWLAFDLHKGLGRVAADMMRTICEERDNLTEPEFNAVCDRLTELICMLAVGDDRPSLGHMAEIEPMVRRYVRQHIGNRKLNLAGVATGLGWSPRQLQTSLQQVGTTYRDLVREERLLAARRLLANPTYQHRPILEIALTCGFSSGSALSLLFKDRYGESPREYRYLALGRYQK